MRTRSQRKASIKATAAITASEPTVEKSEPIEEPSSPAYKPESPVKSPVDSPPSDDQVSYAEHPSLEVEYEPEDNNSITEDPEIDHEVKDLLQDTTTQKESTDLSSQTKSPEKTPNKKSQAPKLSHTNNPLTLTPATSNETESVQSHRIQGINNNNYNNQSKITINDSSNSFVKPREPDYDMVLEQVLKSSKNNIRISKNKPPPGKIQPIIRHRKSNNDNDRNRKYAKRPKINTSNVVISSQNALNTNNQIYNKHMKNSKIYKHGKEFNQFKFQVNNTTKNKMKFEDQCHGNSSRFSESMVRLFRK